MIVTADLKFNEKVLLHFVQMGYSNHIKSVLIFLMALAVTACSNKEAATKPGTAWQVYLQSIGTYSSSRTADLNKDGVLDIVMGAGGAENMASDTAVFALDGSTGEMLWAQSGKNQFVGSAVFKDITEDGVPDVFIGGRWAELAAINGTNGKIIWSFLSQRKKDNPADLGWYNFTSAQFVPDQDKDGLEDLLISNGGNPLVSPYDPNRPPGRILVLSSSSGKILANVDMPDGRETYMSAVILDANKNGNPVVYFGTGGETIGGSLFRTTLKDIMEGNISDAALLVSSEFKGFISPPILVDITLDGIHDVVVNAVDGKMIAIDGTNDSILWQVSYSGTEAYTVPAVGFFNADAVPDFFTNYGIGLYPYFPNSIHFMVDGKTGAVAHLDTVEGFQYASSVVADFNGDGYDEVLVNTSEKKWKHPLGYQYYNFLLIHDFKNNKRYTLGDTLQGTNLASSPWVGDLNNDNCLDIVYSGVDFVVDHKTDYYNQSFNHQNYNIENPQGLYIALYHSNFKIRRPVVWGAYMGSNYTGIFPNLNGRSSKTNALSTVSDK